MIDRATVDKITDAANIVDVVSEFVTLRKSGANYKGLCPFHDDSTPSFYVSPARNLCKCFSCGKGGNPVGFIMEHEQMTYPEALRWLAKKYNIEIQERELTSEEREAENNRESMFIVNEWAAGYFEDLLHNNIDGVAIGLQYFRSRDFRDDIIRKFRLGFDLQSRQALPQAAKAKGYKEEFLVKTGICYKKDNGELQDRFAGRVMFPWISMSGKVVGFGGRLLDKRTKGVAQKYVNSPDSDIYHKEKELYGIYQAKKSIAKENCVYMVEGYTDVISMHQCGIENVVANSGTALSIHQTRMLRRFTPNVVLLYDGDEAGIHAAMRGTDMMLAEGMNIKVLLLPDGEDPDSFARKHSAQDFTKYIKEHQTDFIQFKTDVLLRGVTDPIKRSEAISSIVRSISVIPDQIIRATYLTDCSHRLGINEATLISTMNKMIRSDKEQQQKEETRKQEQQQAQQQQEPLRPATPMQQASEVEKMLVQMIIRHGDEILYQDVETEDGNTINLTVAQFISYDLNEDKLLFTKEIYNRILNEAELHSGEEDFKAEKYFLNHPDMEISRIAAEMAFDPVQLVKSLQIKPEEETLRNKVRHLLLDFRMDYIENKLKSIQAEISRSVNDNIEEHTMKLMAEYKELQIIRNRMAKELGTEIII